MVVLKLIGKYTDVLTEPYVMTNRSSGGSSVVTYTHDTCSYTHGIYTFSSSMGESEKSDSGKGGSSYVEEEEEIFCFIFGLTKNPRGLMHLIHAVWKKGRTATFKMCHLFC